MYTTWEVSYRTLEHQDDGTARLLLLLTFFHRESSWEGLFHLAMGPKGEVTSVGLPVDMSWLVGLYRNKSAFRSAIGRIMSFSFAKRGVPPPPGTIRFHPVVHSWGSDRLSVLAGKRYEIHAMVSWKSRGNSCETSITGRGWQLEASVAIECGCLSRYY